MEMESLVSMALLLLLPLLFLFFLLKPKTNHKITSKNLLPPGPKQWPIIGNLADVGPKPHVGLAKLARLHGPLISLRLGTQLVVVASSPAAAAEILKTHDQNLSGRCVPHVSFAKDPEMNKDSIAWSFECSDRWKSFRTMMRNELFCSKMIDEQSGIRERKAQEMVQFLRRREGEKMEIREVVFVYTFSCLARTYISSGKDLIGFEGGEISSKEVSGLIRDMMELYAALNISDLYPKLGALDLQGLRRKTDQCVAKIRNLWEGIIIERRDERRRHCADVDGMISSSRRKDFLDVLLDSDFSDEQISFFLVEMLAAVSDSSSSTVEWAMAEIMKNGEAMLKIRQELARELSNNTDHGGMIQETQLAKLTYLQACVKETLRIHPPAPLLLPHRATQDCHMVMNEYTIPKDTQVFVNVWAIGRDPSIWKEPLEFKPERFLMNSSDHQQQMMDYKGSHFEYLPFGSGRRICAGMPMAIRITQLALACLIHNFDWSGAGPKDIDMTERYGVTLMKEEPLVLIPKLR